PLERKPVLDLRLLRRRLPDQDAGLPRPRLDAGCLPRRPPARARAALGRAVEGRRLRLLARRPAALPAGDRPLPGDRDPDRAGLDPLRLGHGLHAGQRAPDRRLLLGRPARLHHARHLQPPRRRRRRRRAPDGQPRARGRRDLPDHRPALRAGGDRGPGPHGRDRDAGAGARGALLDRDAGDPGDARVGQLHRRALHPDRHVPGQDRLRARGRGRRRAGRLLRPAPLPAEHAQPPAGGRALARDRAARRARARPAGRLHRRPRPLPGTGHRAQRRLGPGAGRRDLRPGLARGRGRSRARARVPRRQRRRPGPRRGARRLDPLRVPARLVSFQAPHIDYAGLSPVIALTAGIVLVLGAAVVTSRRERAAVSVLTLGTLAAAAGLSIWQWNEAPKDLVAGALRLDSLGLAASLIAIASAAFCVPLLWREGFLERRAGAAGHGEIQALLLASVLGMTMLAEAQNLITLFISLELLSVPLYVLCGAALNRSRSLESGLKYLIVGSLGAATLLYGLAFIYGGTGATDFGAIASAIAGRGLGDDALILVGIGLAATGLAFKTSIAPFHQWTPDVYEGAPTPVTAFMAVATKAAAFAVFARLFLVALAPAVDNWQPALAALAAVSIAVGNIGALGQSSLKRLLGYSGVAQAGYMLVAIVAASAAGVNALVFYLAAYALMNLAAFAVVVVRERETEFGDD